MRAHPSRRTALRGAFAAVSVAVAILARSASAWSEAPPSASPPVASPSVASPSVVSPSAFTHAANRLGFVVLGERIAAEPSANHAFSPLSLSGALALLARGADGDAGKRLSSALGVDGQAAVAPSWRDLAASLAPASATSTAAATGGKSPLALANGLWHAAGLTVDDAPGKSLTEDMGAAVAGLDFADPLAVETVNAWIKEKTAGMIPSILERLSPNTELVVASALAFKADWAVAFKPENTHPVAFAVAGGDKAEVPMMSRGDERFPYLKTGKCAAVMLSYADPDFALMLASPSDDVTPSALLAEGGRDWLAPEAYHPTPGTVTLPRVDLSKRYDLADPEAGPTLAGLLSGPLDLSGLGAAWRDKPQSLGRAVQAVRLRWDETGTEAAAATVITTTRGMSTVENPPFSLIFDRPFAFALMHRPSGAVLLAGVVNDPKS